MNESSLIACETIEPSSSLYLKYELMKPLAEMYSYLGIDMFKLRSQVAIVQQMFENKTGRDVLEFLLSMKTGTKFVFPDLLTFVNLVLTIPVTSAQAERTFSTMKRVKNHLRSSMCQERLGNMCLISIEKELSNELMRNPESIVDEFSRIGNRRLQLK